MREEKKRCTSGKGGQKARCISGNKGCRQRETENTTQQRHVVRAHSLILAVLQLDVIKLTLLFKGIGGLVTRSVARPCTAVDVNVLCRVLLHKACNRIDQRHPTATGYFPHCVVVVVAIVALGKRHRVNGECD